MSAIFSVISISTYFPTHGPSLNHPHPYLFRIGKNKTSVIADRATSKWCCQRWNSTQRAPLTSLKFSVSPNAFSLLKRSIHEEFSHFVVAVYSWISSSRSHCQWKSLRVDLTRVEWRIYGRVFAFHSPFRFFTDSVVWPRAQSLSFCPLSEDQSPCKRERRAKRSLGFDQRSVGISDRSVVRSKTVHAESSERSRMLRVGSERLFSLSLDRQRSEGKMARLYTYIGASVFRRPKFCQSEARLDGLANRRFDDRTANPEMKRCGPTRVRAKA